MARTNLFLLIRHCPRDHQCALVGTPFLRVERMNSRCAIYTRKSADEGLDQEFSSLDAQFEACAARIASQNREGRKQHETAMMMGASREGHWSAPAYNSF